MNKFLLFFLVTSSLSALTGCGGEEKTAAATSENTVPDGMVALDLTQYGNVGLPLIVNVPDKNTGKGELEVMEGPTGGTQVKVGKDFNIEIFPGGGSVADKKASIANDAVFKATYLIDEPDAILYKLAIEDAGITQYHFYAVINAGNLTYEVSDVHGEEDYTEEGIRRMLESAKSIREKPKV